jgi:hypothetical protein
LTPAVRHRRKATTLRKVRPDILSGVRRQLTVPDSLRRHVPLFRNLGIVLVGTVLLWMYVTVHTRGHDWGDDFALYIGQARGLVRGTVAQVVTDNRYSVQNSGTTTFSAYVYPWGFPILLAPWYLMFGIDYAKFKLLEALCLVGAVLAFRHLLKARLPAVPSWALAALIGLSPAFAIWSDTVTSDIPSLMFVMLGFLALDRLRRLEQFESERLAPLIAAGALFGWCFSIRREAIGLLLALGALHAVHVLRTFVRERTVASVRGLRWKSLAAPYVGFVMVVGGLQLALPSAFENQTPGGGRQRIRTNLEWYRSGLGDQLGLHTSTTGRSVAFGTGGWSHHLLTMLLVLAVVGAVGCLLAYRGRDVPLVVFGLSWIATVATQPYHDSRYLFTVTPLVAYFAYQGVPVVIAGALGAIRRATDRSLAGFTRAAPYVSLVLFLPLVQSNWADMHHAIDFHRAHQYYQEGPETRVSQEMFQAIMDCTRGDSVIVFARARAMTLYTGRRAIQTQDNDQAVQRGDYLMLNNSDVNYSEPSIDQDNAVDYGLERVWHNSSWSLYATSRALVGLPPDAACPPEP